MALQQIFTVLLLSLIAVYSQKPSTTPRPEQPITSDIRFYYEPLFHTFSAVTRTTCFLAALTFEEKDHIHTSLGMEDMELRMAREWIGQLPEIKIYHDDPNLPPAVIHNCRDKDVYYLQRTINGTAITTPSPLATLLPGRR